MTVMAKKVKPAPAIEELLRVGDGFRLADVDCESTPGFDGGKSKGQQALADHAAELGDWQEKLHAESRGGGKRSLLLVVQGMDTSGKGGIMRHVVSQIDPEGIRATAFKAPTPEERKHDFLWRVRNALPGPGKVGVFDRSHYEDVLVVRVHELVPRTEWLKRYALINAFERETVASGTRIIKVMTHISKDEQKARLRQRLERPDKHYKYNPGDVDERLHWDDYMEAYQVALTRTSTKAAPWYVVPANKKWYARFAVQQLLLNALTEMAPTWPVMDFDVAAELRRLDAS
jgi:PPK2 family polyphosphate:nucleotide phosphotransferase